MGLRDVQQNWELFGKQDPLWAILTAPGKENNLWSKDEFFETGRREILDIVRRLEGIGSGRRRRALDFGCGVGRLTQSLADHFDRVCGVDIAPSMLELARRYNRHGERCEYILNQHPHLQCFDNASFDLIYSRITLQHMPPRYIRRYLREFLRIAAPGGVIVFSLPSALVHPRLMYRLFGKVAGFFYRNIYWKLFQRGTPRMDMHGISPPRVTRLLESHGGKLIAAEKDGSAGPAWNSHLYIVTKP